MATVSNDIDRTRKYATSQTLNSSGPSTARQIKSHIANVIIIIVIINRLWAFIIIIINRISDFRGADRSYDR